MKTAQSLRDDFERKLKELQESCKHPKSKWMEYHWAPGHSSGMCKVCDNCEKMLGSEPEVWSMDDILKKEG